MANPPQIIDAFERARAQEALAQALVARAAMGRNSLTHLVRLHVSHLAEVSDIHLAWWVQRTWFMLARREVHRLRKPRSPLMVTDDLSAAVIDAFQWGPAMTAARAELVQLLACQGFAFMMIDDDSNDLPPNTRLAELEWDLAVAGTVEGKVQALQNWRAAVAVLPYPQLGMALQRLLDPDQFWQADQVARKRATELLPWVDVPGWTRESLRGHLREQFATPLWATFLPLIEASFPKLPDLSALSQALGVPLMAPIEG